MRYLLLNSEWLLKSRIFNVMFDDQTQKIEVSLCKHRQIITKTEIFDFFYFKVVF